LLYDKLKQLGLDYKTLIIVTSDHGENLGEHGSLSHGGPPWDSVTHVPLIMIYPPLILPGTRVKGLTESVDIVPTVLDLCRIKLPPGKSMDGISLVRFMQNPEGGKEAVFTLSSIRTKNYKYMLSYNHKKAFLYNLRNDPQEREDIAEQRPLIRKEFESRYRQVLQPYKNRFEKSKKEGPVTYPFYFKMNCFNMAPPDVLERCYDRRDYDVILKEANLTKPWLYNSQHSKGLLLRLPKNGASPISLSTHGPNGIYNVSILLQSPGEIYFQPKKLNFGFRFDSKNKFRLPDQIDFAKRAKDGFFYNYLNLGKAVVKNEKFSLEINFNPSGETPYYAIRHIKFAPEASKKKGDIELPDEEELQRKKEALKSLGYL